MLNQKMEIKNKIILAHSGFFNRDCKKAYRENSKEVCAISTRKKNISIIELDIRKSKDGVLYCYHGTLLEYYIFLKIPMNFSKLKHKYNVDRLEDILKVITKNKIVFLDIKDKNITKNDLLNAFNNRRFKEVILANKSVSLLSRYNNMPKQFVKILNGNIFCNFYSLKKLKRDNFKYFEVVFPFQINHRIIKRLKENKMELRCASLFFLNKKSYFKKIEKYKIKHISSDFI